MDCKRVNDHEKRERRKWQKSFTEALKEKYCMDLDEPTIGFIIVSPKRRSCTAQAELAHLKTVVLNEMNLTRAGIPQQGLKSLCPNVVDLDLASNMFEHWSELLSILSHLPRVKYVNVSRNSLTFSSMDELPKTPLSVENLALNDTGVSIDDVVKLSELMPHLKELHLCGNGYEDLATIDEGVQDGHLSALECLRLNNNGIKSWSEIWKLRHLPHLKDLVLSGNPLDRIYYGDQTKTPTCKEDKDVVCEEEMFLQMATDCLDYNMNGSDLDAEEFMCRDLLVSEACEEEDEDSDGRPVSRFDRHKESDVSDDDLTSTSAVSSVDMDIGSYSPRNSNYNNSHSAPRSKSLYDAELFEEGGNWFGMFPFFEGVETEGFENLMNGNETNADGEGVEEEEEDDDWHKAVAEAFLQDIISNLEFPDEREATRPPQCPPAELSPMTSSTESTSENLQNQTSASAVTAGSTNLASEVGSIRTEMDRPHEGNTNLASEVGSIRTEMDQPHEGNTNQNALCDPDGSAVGVSTYSDDGDLPYVHSQCGQRKTNTSSLSDETVSLDAESPSGAVKTPVPCRAKRNIFAAPVDNQPRSCERCGKPFSKIPDNFQAESIGKPEQVTGNTNVISEKVCVYCTKLSPFTVCDSSESTAYKSHPPSKDVNINETSPRSTPLRQAGSPNSTECKGQVPNNSPSNSPQQNDNSLERTLTPGDLETDQHVPFHKLEMLCLSNANVSHWKHLQALSSFPKLTNVRLLENPLYATVNPEDRRKLYIASLPNVKILNGSEVVNTEREKAERHYLRYYMDLTEKPDFFHSLVKKHGPPVKLVEIDLSAGYQEWASLSFVLDGVVQFTKKLHLTEPVTKLRTIISKEMLMPKHSFTMYHNLCAPSHPEYERELIELRCEAMPMSRCEFSEGDEIHIIPGF